jgi:signal transduction histidine kinase
VGHDRRRNAARASSGRHRTAHGRLHRARRHRDRNADSRAQLTASRARIVAAAARRRIERDLHDGTQQRLVALSLGLRLAQSTVPAELPQLQTQIRRVADELTGAIEELRELARGIHPAILSEGGLARPCAPWPAAPRSR